MINLGWDGSGTAPIDLITNAPVEATTNVTLGAGSITSVSEINSLTGQPMIIPYGITYNGVSWIDPAGNDITTGGVPEKTINISGANIAEEKGATIDIRGGGDLLAYQFVPGILGSNDILASTRASRLSPAIRLPTLPMPRTTPAAASTRRTSATMPVT